MLSSILRACILQAVHVGSLCVCYDLCVSNQQAHRQEGEVSEGNHRMPDLRLGPVRPHRQPHAGPSAPEDPEPRCRSAREEIRESAGRCHQE